MYPFWDGIGLRITCCDWPKGYSIIFFQNFCYFCHEFAPQPRKICGGHGYLVINIFSTLLTIISAHFVLIDIMSNHMIAGSIIVNAHNYTVWFLGCLNVWGTIKLMHSTSHGVALAYLCRRCQYLIFSVC